MKALVKSAKTSVPLILMTAAGLKKTLKGQSKAVQAWVKTNGFKGLEDETLILPNGKGGLAAVLHGLGRGPSVWSLGALPFRLPQGSYTIASKLPPATQEQLALGWALGSYGFTRYKKAPRAPARLVVPEGVDVSALERVAEGTAWVRDLVNTPAGDLGPEALEQEARTLAKAAGAKIRVVKGAALLEEGYATIHAVGRAADQAPRLIDLSWGKSGPKITLVGKGVTFDSGGLDIKPAAGMLIMKKDMGGAAHALALAGMIMDADLPVRLRVLVPAVENAIAGNAFHPQDIITTKAGITVEVGNTDAEGRLILCDALAEAEADDPDLLVDFATLTGAARTALGPDLPALFASHDETAQRLLALGQVLEDPLWRLPLHQPYRQMLRSKIADINNTGGSPMAGAITAALFLQAFVSDQRDWLHLDLYAWNQGDRPGRPAGGEAFGLRAVYALIRERATV